jgi:hypothetical protein
MDVMHLIYVAPPQLPQMWEQGAKAHIEKVVAQAPGYSLQSIYDEIASCHLQLWLVFANGEHVASFTTCVQIYPECKELECVHLGGERMQEWGGFVTEKLKEFGKANGCEALITMGRKGTERMYKQWGFNLDAVRLRQVII